MNPAKLIFKKMDGIKYFSDKIDGDGKYRLWESKTHPKYAHFMKAKDIINKTDA